MLMKQINFEINSLSQHQFGCLQAVYKFVYKLFTRMLTSLLTSLFTSLFTRGCMVMMEIQEVEPMN